MQITNIEGLRSQGIFVHDLERKTGKEQQIFSLVEDDLCERLPGVLPKGGVAWFTTVLWQLDDCDTKWG